MTGALADSGLTPFDLALLVVIGVSALMGLIRGLLREVLSLVTWVAAFLLALSFGPALSAWFPLTEGAVLPSDPTGGLVRSDTVSRVVGFVAVFVLTLLVGGLVQWGVRRLVESTGLTSTDRVLGLLFGTTRGVVIVIVVLIAIRPFVAETTWWRTSQLREHLLLLEDDVLTLIGESRRLIGEQVR
jgi:membrane protein required for colicin V production